MHTLSAAMIECRRMCEHTGDTYAVVIKHENRIVIVTPTYGGDCWIEPVIAARRVTGDRERRMFTVDQIEYSVCEVVPVAEALALLGVSDG